MLILIKLLFIMLLTKIIISYNRLQLTKITVINDILNNFIESFLFLRNYYILNDLVWQDGFLIDFLQKKVVDKWMRKFLIFSAYLFNERLVFDYVVRFYIDLIVWPSYRINIYEFNNVSSTLLITLFLLIILFLVFSLTYFFILFF